MDILDVGLFEVGVINLTHDAAPTRFGVKQLAGRRVNLGTIKVIGATLGRIEREVKGLND